MEDVTVETQQSVEDEPESRRSPGKTNAEQETDVDKHEEGFLKEKSIRPLSICSNQPEESEFKSPENPNAEHEDKIDKLEEDFPRTSVDELRKLMRPFSICLRSIDRDAVEEYFKSIVRKYNRNVESNVEKSKPCKRKFSDDGDNRGAKRIKSSARKNIQRNKKPKKCTIISFHSSADMDGKTIYVGDFVTILGSHTIGQIKYLWENSDGEKNCHLQCFIRSCETILKEVGYNQEIFATEDCKDISLADVDEMIEVDMISFGDTFQKQSILHEWQKNKTGLKNTFMCQKRYDSKSAQFRDLLEGNELLNECLVCLRRKELENQEIPSPCGPAKLFDQQTQQYTFKTIRWRGEKFGVGSCIFLHPGTLMKFESPPEINLDDEESYDELQYPEKYRKKLTKNDENLPKEEPFDIGYILKIYSKKSEVKETDDVCLLVKKFYRPHNTHLKQREADQMRLNLLYWSEEECSVKFDKVFGKCFVAYEKNLEIPVDEWSAAGPFRFYFSEAYDVESKRFLEPSELATRIGNRDSKNTNEPLDWPKISRPLRSMDVFAGCGGFSAGLHEAGVARCLWAVEKIQAPAASFKLNNEETLVYTEDCNLFLSRILRGDKTVPQKGEVELMCGGPPCQGFTRMNRFKEGVHSQLKNSLITTYLSFCDHYRPRFFIMENVRGFVSNQKNKILRTTLSCLLLMGYQVGFAVLQSGKYGVPQDRRRIIILAAAPGEILPNFPDPTNTFSLHSSFGVQIDSKKYEPGLKWTTSAPYRTLNVYDAISDLPKLKISNVGSNNELMPYKSEPLTHFQLKMRETNPGIQNELLDHVSKKVPPLTEKRIEYIPREPVGDWRDLPNIVVRLANGENTKKLKYTYDDYLNGKSKNGELRGVCVCATSPLKKECKEEPSRQAETLIPWCLPHTGNRHHHWSGLYGRVGWSSCFRTVVTNPEPMAKQGRVLHPEEDRVLSVRECARAQGFSDSFKFYGTTKEKYSQIGNAVAPPFAKAIGLEIKKSVAKRPELL